MQLDFNLLFISIFPPILLKYDFSFEDFLIRLVFWGLDFLKIIVSWLNKDHQVKNICKSSQFTVLLKIVCLFPFWDSYLNILLTSLDFFFFLNRISKKINGSQMHWTLVFTLKIKLKSSPTKKFDVGEVT
jgi:uncharacterized membrane protein